MNTTTRLRTMLIFCILALTLNAFAVVKDLYVQPAAKVADAAPATRNTNLISLSSY